MTESIEPTEHPHIPELEEDETVPPRPEEEAADALRSEPDLEAHPGDADSSD